MANLNRAGMIDEIRCDEKDYLIWKWQPANNARRENAIRWGSSLRVREGSVAVFVCRRKGQDAIQEFIEGPFDEALETSNLPIIASFVAAAYGGGTPFQAEVYFINLAKVIQSRFAVRYFDVFDQRFPDFGAPVAVRGTLTFKIVDYREFIELHRLDEFTLEDFQTQVRDVVSRRVKSLVASMPSKLGIPLLQLAGRTDDLSELANEVLSPQLRKVFGIELSSLDIAAIDVDEESDGYARLMAVTRDVTEATVQAQTEANIKNIHDMQRIQMENLQERLRIEREEGQYRVHKQTQTANFPAYQVEAQTTVGVAGAEALGHMGENGAAGIDLGGSGNGGMDMAGIAAGMAIGGSIGRNIAGAMDNMMGNTPAGIPGSPVPPPIPQERFHVAANGKATGPFDLTTLSSMVASRSLTPESLVWQEGMTNWMPAKTVPAIAELFNNGPTPPPIPVD
ncbi:MAG: SPFH domain-containing protein [Collinsella bouchesdurhonensis]|nr:SPFH domain-containing protein [Collinsella bouchesdurhonensis]